VATSVFSGKVASVFSGKIASVFSGKVTSVSVEFFFLEPLSKKKEKLKSILYQEIV